jgi:putative RNA 2'-phosphotransferase
MNKRDLAKLRKILLSILGKCPNAFGVVLEEGGWITMKRLHKVVQAEQGFAHITPRSLVQFFALYRPDEFELQDQSVRIRPALRTEAAEHPEVAEPPDVLYVCIRPRAHAHVLANGLRPSGTDKWIALSTTKDMALRIGMRRDPAPITAKVMASKASEAGIVFRKTGDFLYLVDGLGPEYLGVPALPKTRTTEREKTEKSLPVGKRTVSGSAPPSERPGSFILRDRPSTLAESTGGRKRQKGTRTRDPEWKQERRKRGRR